MENSRIEILAPAGSKESFITAVEAGADAVYCGLKDFSARSKASNFTPAELNNYINYAHKKNVKVYVAFNTLIKQIELKDAVKQINFIEQANADAVIVQDLGVANIVKKYFPRLKLHASTQLAIHNSYGVLEAEKAGFKRVVLARELSLQEIKSISKNTNTELEIFCHGALCFGVSGLCLMSSFIGGASGNRGMCSQPCRRKWTVNKKDGFYISPKDLDLSNYAKDIAKSGIISLKIEGRMKNPQYVYKTVKAYKILFSAGEKNFAEVLKEVKEILNTDFARTKTSFNFIQKSKDIFAPETAKQIGAFAGDIISVKDNVITLKTKIQLNKTDALKAADSKADAYFKINVLDIRHINSVIPEKAGIHVAVNSICDNNKMDSDFHRNDTDTLLYEIETDTPGLKSGMQIFKTADGNFEEFLQNIIKTAEIEKKEFSPAEKNISYPKFKKSQPQEKLFIKINDINWLPVIQKTLSPCHPELASGSGSSCFNGKMLKQVQHDTSLKTQKNENISVIFTLDKENIKHASKIENIKYFELPPYIDEHDLPLFEQALNNLKDKTFFVNNISHFMFFKKEDSLLAGNFLYVLNSFAADFLFKNRINGFMFSGEDDFKNISDLAKNGLSDYAIFYISGFPTLAVSLMTACNELSQNKNIESAKDIFQVIHRNGKTNIMPQYPVMLFNKKKRLEKLGVNKFIIDLSFINPNKTYLDTVLNAFLGKIPLQNGWEFNFERGLK
ncbi:MAG: U32 family peptidase [Endomicrobia bacterium]|nr:U32 family peptidase [Endomicrobiia bacterium]MCL2507483.1 U32 family peptidase [Endomicrobiia bacterium]